MLKSKVKAPIRSQWIRSTIKINKVMIWLESVTRGDLSNLQQKRILSELLTGSPMTLLLLITLDCATDL